MNCNLEVLFHQKLMHKNKKREPMGSLFYFIISIKLTILTSNLFIYKIMLSTTHSSFIKTLNSIYLKILWSILIIQFNTHNFIQTRKKKPFLFKTNIQSTSHSTTNIIRYIPSCELHLICNI